MVAGSHCGYDERSQVCPYCGREWVYQPRDHWHDEAYWFCELHQHVSDISPVKACCPLCEDAFNAEQERLEARRAYQRQYYLDHHERLEARRAYYRQYYRDHHEHLLEMSRESKRRRAAQIRKYNMSYFQSRYYSDAAFREKRKAYNSAYNRRKREEAKA